MAIDVKELTEKADRIRIPTNRVRESNDFFNNSKGEMKWQRK